MELSSGTKLGPYVVLSRIGAGGMGQVWKARDTRLDRIVAIKVFSARFSDRFEREARAVAALNHPHICTLYDVGPDYLVMEFVDGQEIRGPLPLERVLRTAIQMANALDAAHRVGITHRDLKPANLMLTRSGVKLLDFGLAKATPLATGSAGDETVAGALTREGEIVGTLQYMSPEQLQSKPADARSDIFSFGCVLYEMVTGRRAFDGANSASVIAAILEREAPPVAPLAPAELDWAIRRCLAKDPDDRWQTAVDLRATLERIANDPGQSQARSVKAGVPVKYWITAAILAGAIAALAYLVGQRPSATLPVIRTSIDPPPNGRFSGTTGVPPAVSPDGSAVVFEAAIDGRSQLWLRPVNSTPQPLPGTANGTFPFWSPDSRSIGFFADGKLKRVEATGGAAITLANASGGGGSWSSDGMIVFAGTYAGSLQKLSANGGTPRPATATPASPQPERSPWFLPDGKHFLYLSGSGQGKFVIHAGSVDSAEADRELPDTADSSNVAYSSGAMLFLHGNTLVARPFDEKKLVFTGDAVPITERVNSFGISSTGILVYHSGTGALRLAWHDRTGKRLSTVDDAGDVRQVELSPNQKLAALTLRDVNSGNVDIWVLDLERSVRTRLTFSPFTDAFPVWSPDGRSVVYRSNRSGQFDIYRTEIDSPGKDELVWADNTAKVPTSVSPDGQNLAYWIQDPKAGNGIAFLPDMLRSPHTAKPAVWFSSEFSQNYPRFSPDGRSVVYQSDETGRTEIYVAGFPGFGRKRQISGAGGSAPRWRPDGRELFYVGADNHLTAVTVAGGREEVAVQKVEPLFSVELANASSYNLSDDGQRILLLAAPDGDGGKALIMVQNWTAGLKR